MNAPLPHQITQATISPVEELLAELRAGRMVVLVDDEDRENEGDLIIAADHVTPQAINFMASQGRGLICLALTRERCERLRLPLITRHNGTRHATAFTVSIEAAEGVTTGISAFDRARTIQAAVRPGAQPGDLVQPGHVFPPQAAEGGVLQRAGHTEAGCDLARLAGCSPAAVICEVMNADGTMARLPDLRQFAAQHGLKLGTIADLIRHRRRTEQLIERVHTSTLDTHWGAFTLHAYREAPGQRVHLALVLGHWTADEVIPVSLHESPSLLDALALGSSNSACTLGQRIARIAAAGRGVVVLLDVGETAEQLLRRCTESAGPTALPGSEPAPGADGITAQLLRDCGVSCMQVLDAADRWTS